MNKKTIIKRSSIVDEKEVCVYCGHFASWRGCCGEVHYEPCYILENGDSFAESEIDEIIEDEENYGKIYIN